LTEERELMFKNYTDNDKRKLIAELLNDYFGDSNIARSGAEIGVWRGETSVYLMSRFQQLKYFGIDPYATFKNYKGSDDHSKDFNFIEEGFHHLKWYESEGEADSLYRRVLFEYDKFGSRAELIRETSSDAVKSFEDESLDFVYIDGNHDYNFVKEDIDLWTPKVKRTGLIIGDDFNWKRSVEDVARAVVEKFGFNYSVMKNTWWITKADYLKSL